MEAQQFLAEFGHIANAPGGITRLRELILELAIRGELLDSSDQPGDAAMLLSEIERHKAALIREGKLKRITPLPAISTSELSFQLPTNWRFERLGNVCEIVRGVTFPASKKQTVPSDTSVICLRTSNVQAEVDWNDLIYIDEELVGREDQWVEEGDTLISMANSYELVGKVALVRNLYARATFGGFLGAIRPHLLDPEYLYLVLRSPYMQSRMRSTASQTTNIANISLGGMRPIPTPIPPKEEQARIVAKVDELMALCEKLEAQQQDRRKLQNTLRQSVLQAVAAASSPHELQTAWARLAENFGRLFQRPEDVTELRALVKDLAIHGLLVRLDDQAVRPNIDERQLEIRREELRKAKSIRASRPVSLPHDFEEPFPLPSSWKWFSLDQICYQITDGAHHTPRYVSSGVPFISVKDISGEFIDFSSTKFVSQETHDELVKRCNPEFGDILLTKVGTTGVAKVVDTQRPFSLFVSVALLKFPQDIVDPHFLELLISSPFVKRQSEEGTRGIGNKNLVLNTIKGFLIPLPPISEQRLILTKAAELIKFCDLLESQLRSSIELVGRLAVAAVSGIVGIPAEQEEEEPVKAPQNELIAPLRLGQMPDIKAQAPLATILTRHHGEMSAKDLWQRFGGEIDAFYAQLKIEVAHGWILEPETAVMREKELA